MTFYSSGFSDLPECISGNGGPPTMTACRPTLGVKIGFAALKL